MGQNGKLMNLFYELGNPESIELDEALDRGKSLPAAQTS
jgi:hypothetical protein